MSVQDRTTGRLLLSVALASLLSWGALSVAAVSQVRDHNVEARTALRREVAANLAAHVHPSVPTREEMMAGATFLVAILSGLMWRVHRTQAAAQERAAKEQEDRLDRHSIQLSEMAKGYGTLNAQIREMQGTLAVEMRWLHGEAGRWREAAEQSRRDTIEAMRRREERRQKREDQ